MRPLLSGIVLPVTILLIFASPTFAQDDLAKIKETIQQINAEYARASVEGDWDAVFSYYLDDVVIMPNFYEIIRGKENWRLLEDGATKRGRRINTASFATLDLWACGDVVYETGKYAMTMTLPGLSNPYSDQGKYLSIWQKQKDGSLKVKVLIWNTDLDFRTISAQLK
jgi:ketosteroid isomerase-like protein